MRKANVISALCILFCITACNSQYWKIGNDVNVEAKDVLSDDYGNQGTGMFGAYYGYGIQEYGTTEFYQSNRFSNTYPYNVNLEILYAPRFDFPSPAGVDIIVSNGDVHIGLPVNDIDINPNYYPTINEQLRSDEWYQSSYDGRGYLYYGKLQEISSGVYISDGHWVDDLSKFEDFTDTNVDFYLVYKYESVYLFFEKIDVDTIYDQVQFGLPHFTKVLEGIY